MINPLNNIKKLIKTIFRINHIKQMQGYRIRFNIGKNFTIQLAMVHLILSISNKKTLFKSQAFKIVFVIVTLFAFSQAIAEGTKQSLNNTLSVSDSITDLDQAEELWGSINYIEMQKAINNSLKLSITDGILYWSYLQDSIYSDKIKFLNNYKTVTTSGFPLYINNLTQSYIKLYSYFETIKTAYAQQQAEQANFVQAAAGPCTNMDFTNGLNGWTVYRAKADDNAWTNGGTFPAPSGVTAGQANPARVNVKSVGGTDPFIPSISVTPGASYPNSVMIEDYLNGGNASELSQTFAVTAANSLLTYKYAIVLESPNHSHKQNPYFTATLTVNGVAVSCVKYSSIADPNVPADIAGFTYAPNVNNPYTGSDPVNANSPTVNLYYKNWTTVAIPLDKYIGQNATITFTTADCSIGGHRGYAYVWAECSSVSTFSASNYICSPETTSFSAPAGFKSYQWTGPGIVGAANTSSVQLNKPGAYSLILTPQYDSSGGTTPCYDTLKFNVLEHCSPTPITETLCETTQGSGKATGVNLTSYNSAITAYNAAATVQGWYSGTPPSAGNKVATPTNVTVNNGSKYYAVITYPSLGIGGDTAQLNFVINSQATANAGGAQSICANNDVVTLNGSVTVASGGTWTSNGTGSFANPNLVITTYTPSAADISSGSVKLTLTSTGNQTGCGAITNSATITITASPTVNAGGNQTVCANNDKVTLNGSFVTGTGVTGVVWTTSGSGTFANKNSASTTYTPSAADVSSGNVTLTLSTIADGKTGSCVVVSNSMTLKITAAPVVSAGNPQTLCANNAVATLTGSVSNPFQSTWSTSGTGTFGNINQLNTTYTPSANDIKNGSVTLTLTSGNNGTCNAVTSTTTITYTTAPKLTATTTATACSNNPAVNLTSSVSGGATGVQWSNGNGTFLPNSTSASPQYIATTAEINGGGIELLVTTTGNGNCIAITDTVFVIFFPAPVVSAGTGSNVCSNNSSIKLNGTATNSPTTTTWGGGSGTYAPNANTLNATYTPSAAEISAGNVTLTLTVTKTQCNNVTSNVAYTISPTPVVSTGGNQSVCSNNATVTVNGSVTNATGGIWTTSGTGTFANNTSLNTTYTPSAADISSKTVTLTLTSTGNGNCNPVASSTVITFTASPTVSVTTTTPTVCANNSPISLNYSTTIASAGVWSSSGTGTFTPSNTATTATYTPSANDITAGNVTFTVTSTGNGNCNAVTGNVKVTITSAPTVSAGSPQTVCANNATINLSGSYSGATGVLWSGGNGTFGSNTSAITTYAPTAAELLSGSVTLTLTTTGNGLCNPVSSNVKITIIQAPDANAGSDQTLCGTTKTVSLNGSVVNSPSGGTWTTSGTGTFSPGATTLNATYNASANDISTGKINLILTTTGNSLCKEESDTLTVTFTVAPAVNAGPAQTVCTNGLPVQLAGTGSPSTWTDGNGTFLPNNTTLNATYMPTAAEETAGSVTLTLTSQPSGACPQVSSTIKITIKPGPVVNAGPDQTVCGNTNTVQLNGSVTNAGGGSWTTTGTGTFNSNTSLNGIYTASAADIAAGTVKLALASTGSAPCTTERDTMMVTFTPIVSVNAGPNQTYCADVTSIPLNGSATNGGTTTWTTSGTGTFANVNNPITTYSPSAADTKAGSVTLTLATSPIGACPQFTSNATFTFTPAPTVSAGANQTICSDASSVNLTGTVTVAAGQIWTSTGTGTFSPDATVLNPTYVLSAADASLSSITFILTTTGNGTCNAYSSQSVVTITPKPVANAGGNQTICADAGGVSLNGTATNSSSTTWTTSGTGTFNPNANTLNATYVPSAADISAGTVTLTLTAIGNGVCGNSSVNKMFVTINPAPTVNAGNNITVCANNPAASLNGSVTIATGVTWTGGTGTFNPNANTLNATYTPSASEISAGSVTLTLTTTGNGLCKPKTAQVVITIAPTPIVGVGAGNETICADSSFVALNGTIANAAGGLWTTSGTGNFYSNATVLNANYEPSAADIASGKVTLTLTSQGNGTCNAISNSFTVTITPAPTVSAGPSQTVCADAGSVQLNGTVTVAAGGAWTTSGTGTFTPSNTILNAKYIPSATDIATGSVTLTLTTTGNGLCKQIFSSMQVTINPAPTVSAGPAQTICADASTVSLNGTVTVATGGTWTTNGTGVFLPNNTTLNATYEPSPADKSSGGVALTLTTTGNGLCHAVSSSMNLTITPAPTISAGGNQSVCANNSIVTLKGTVTNAGGAAWTSTGTGTFTPDPDTISVQYYPSPADVKAGSVTFTVTSQNNGLCKAVADQAIITITPAPTVNAGTDTTVCTSTNFVPLHGQYTVVDSILWLTSGSGSFSPNANTVSADYIPSASDIVSGTVTLTLTSKDNKNCLGVSDEKVITLNAPPTATAGPDQTICADATNITLSGTVKVATGGVWTSSGSGTFTPNATTLNATYTPSAADKTNGNIVLTLTTTGNGVCSADTSKMNLTITPVPTANAGSNQTICSNTSSVTLNGTVFIPTSSDGQLKNGSSIVWTTSGNGTFSPGTDTVNTTYIPSATDISNGSVTLTLTADYGTCKPAISSMTVSITTAPTANAGSPQTICANTNATLNGSITGATGATWSTASGTGTFLPNANALNATFTPSAKQITNGKATLTLTTNGSGVCNAATSTVLITITPAPTVNAGSDLTVCLGLDSVPLNASETVATGVTWSKLGSASGSFTPSVNSLTPYYHPSATDFTTGTIPGFIQLAITTTGNGTCNPVSDTMNLSFSPTPPVDAGPGQTVCTTNFPIQLQGSGNTGVWSGGTGKFTPDDSSLTAQYTPSTSEISAQQVKLYLTTISSGGCLPGKDSVTIAIQAGPTASPGNDTTVCSNTTGIALKGKVTVAAGGRWSTDGGGTFTPNDSTLNATYVPSASDIADGNVLLTLTTIDNGICQGVSKSMTISFDSLPTVNAGSNQLVCATTASINLTGKVTHSTNVLWSGGNGGTFTNANSLNASYSPSAADVSAGSATLTLTALSDGTCNAVSGKTTITFGTLPTASTGATDTSVCASITNVPLFGSITTATGGTWTTSGSGTFSPNANTLITSYIPSAADTTAHSVTITLTTTANGTCPQASANKVINFAPVPAVSAGTNTTACSNASSFNITGTFSNATGVQWNTSGTGTFTSGINSTNATYQPSVTDKSSGITLSLTTTPGVCPSAFSNVLITFISEPTANAGADQKLCVDVTTIDLEGIVTNATGGVWSLTPGATGVITNPDSLNATYAPSAADLAAKSVKLAFTSTGSGVCAAVSDTMMVTFTPAPTVNAGGGQTVCADTAYVQLNGSVTIATQGVWTSSGTGTFSPDADVLSVKYYPSSADTAAHSVKLILTSTNNGTCNPRKDSLIVTIEPKPVVNAGTGQELCASVTSINLNGSVKGAPNLLWATNAKGTITNPTSASAVYSPTTADKASGEVTISLTSQGGLCKPVTSYITYTFSPTPAAIVDAGFNQTVCVDATSIPLNGKVEYAGGGIWSTGLNGSGKIGTGTFSPIDTLLTGSYLPSTADKTSGKITLRLTSTHNGLCNAVTDSISISFTPSPVIKLKAIPASVCGDTAGITLNGNTVTIAEGGVWTSSGSGKFTPDADQVNGITYIPSAADIAAQKVALTLTTTGNGTCNSRDTSIIIKITPVPVVSAGGNQTLCASATSVALSGSVKNAQAGNSNLWTTSGNGTFSSPLTLNTVYTPTAADTAAGRISFTLTTSNNGQCKPEKNEIDVTFSPIPVVVSGPSVNDVCADISNINLSGKVSNATGGVWSSLGSGVFANADSIKTTYKPSQQDIAAGKVTLVLTSSGNGVCKSITDTSLYNIAPKPIVTASSSVNCIYNGGDTLTGTVTNATGGVWTSSGSGEFSPDESALNVVYYPSAADKTAGQVTLTLTSVGNGTCNAVNAQLALIVSPAPIANAGTTRYICEDSSTTLTAVTKSNVHFVWKALSGTILTTPDTLEYAKVAINKTAATFVLTVTDQKGCFSRDTIVVNPVKPVTFTLAKHYCFSDTLALDALPDDSISSLAIYQWYQNGILLPNQNDTILKVPSAGWFKVVYSLGSCSFTDSTKVTDPPYIISSDQTIACINQNVKLHVNVTKTSGDTYTYQWTRGGANIGTTDSISAPTATDTNYYYVNVTDNLGCNSLDSTRVIGIPQPTFGLFTTKDSSCQGLSVTLNALPTNLANIGSLPAVYKWTENNVVLTGDTTNTIKASTTGQYIAILTIDQCSNSDTSSIIIHPLPTITNTSDKFCFRPTNLNDTINSRPVDTLKVAPGYRYTSYTWFTSNGVIDLSSGKDSILPVRYPGTYYVSISNAFNCTDTSSVVITEVCTPEVFIPNTFEPGVNKGNGINNKFYVIGNHFDKNDGFSLEVFNRWGEVIFKTTDPSPDAGWDGSFGGEPMPLGEYPCIITYRGDTQDHSSLHREKKSILLLR